jgi:hypothetical protein
MKLIKAVSEAPDITAAKALSAVLSDLNAGASARATITAEDGKMIEGLRVVTDDFARSLTNLPTDVLTAGHYFNPDRDAAKIIVADVGKYLELVQGTAEVVVAGQTIQTPAIESPAVRAHIRRVGDEIVNRITLYIADRNQKIASLAAQRKADDEALAVARKLPLLGPVISVLDELLAKMEADPDTFAWRHASNAFPPVIAELLRIPPIEKELRNVTTTSLIDTLERQRKEKQIAA